MVARHLHHNRGNKLQRFAYNLATLPGLPWCASRPSGILYSALAGGGRREAFISILPFLAVLSGCFAYYLSSRITI